MEESDALSCKICFSPFDNNNHAPRIIPGCWQHTVCTSCINSLFKKNGLGGSSSQVFKCPFDNIAVRLPKASLEFFPKNLELIATIEEIQLLTKMMKKGVCKIHDKKLEYVCLDHRYQICMECSKMELHANHKVRMVTDMVREQKEKVKQMLEMIKKIEGYQQTLDKQNQKGGGGGSAMYSEVARKVISWKKRAQEKLVRLHNNGAEELDLDIFEEDLDKVGAEVTEWIETMKNEFIMTLMIFFTEHGIKSEDIEIKDVLIEPRVIKKKIKPNQKTSVWGLFKQFLQVEEVVTKNEPEEEETEEEKLKRIRKLSFVGTNLGDEGLRHFVVALSKLSSLSHLSLDFSDNTVIGKHLIGLNNYVLRKLTNLTSLTLNFQQCTNVNDDCLIDFAETVLPRISNLQVLNLNFSECSQLTDAALKSIANANFPENAPLNRIFLNFAWCTQITDDSFRELSNAALSRFSDLHSLHLDFSHCKGITDVSFKEFAINGLSKLHQLITLNLNFQNCGGLTDVSFECLAKEGLSKMLFLNNLSLNFAWCSEIGDHSFTQFATEALPKFYNLIDLQLDYSWCDKIDDISFEVFANHLGSQVQLISLSLKFPTCKGITDFGINNLVRNSLPKLTYLDYLSLDFSWCSHITNPSIKELANSTLIKLVKLSTLELNFSNCPDITDESLMHLAMTGIPPLTELTNLRLNFSSCSRITNGPLEEMLVCGFLTVNKLKQIKLDLASCNKLTEKPFTEFVKKLLPRLTELQKFHLNLEGCSKVNSGKIREAFQSKGSSRLDVSIFK